MYYVIHVEVTVGLSFIEYIVCSDLCFNIYISCTVPRAPVNMALTVDVVIAGNVVRDAIMGSASTVNIMPYHTMKALRLQPTGPSTHSLLIPGGGESIPAGVIEDVPVDVGRVRILTTFHVLPMPDPKRSYSLLLGMPWLSAARATIECDKDRGTVVKISGGNETITIPGRRTASDEQGTGYITLVQIGRSLTSE